MRSRYGVRRLVNNVIKGVAKLAALLAIISCCVSTVQAATPVPAVTPPENPLGLHAAYFKENGAALNISQAIANYRDKNFTPGSSPVFSFGIGSKPVWIAFEVDNKTNAALVRRLSVETSWLDKLDVYFLNGNTIESYYKLGDAQPFSDRPTKNRFFDIDHAFGPGISQVFIRVETTDPMVVPIYLRTPDAATDAGRFQNYSYGFVYGFLLALMAYNAMLYAGLRSRRYIYYAIYLAAFVLMNFAYTGHGFAFFWPNHPGFQLWIIPFLMLIYGMSGFLFASSFMNTRINFPRMHRAIIRTSAFFALLLLVLFVMGENVLHMKTAFVFGVVFPMLMLLLGVLAIRSGYKPAWYFLFGAIAAMTGALLTTLAVSGIIAFNVYTYRAVEVGMLADAVLLALALAYQFRVNQTEKLVAERMARIDPLTGLNNRRAFYEVTKPIWGNALRNRRDVSVILFDIDKFKTINDNYGHAAGDEVLVAIASMLAQSAREGDVVARWGGEEFILFLPETNLDAAIAMAERLRVAISEKRMMHAKGEISFTASFGVAQRSESCASIEELTSVADKCLYQSKHEGRNRVSHALAGSK